MHYEQLLEKLAELQRANPDDDAVREQVSLTEGLVRDARLAVGASRRTGEGVGAAEGEAGGGEAGEGVGASQPAVMKLRLKLSLVQAEAAYSEACYAIDAAAELLPLLRPPPEPSMLASRQASSSSTPDGRTKTARSQSISSATAEPAAIAPAGAANTAPAAATLSSAGGVALSVLVEVVCEDGISLRLLDDSTGTRKPTPSRRLSPHELACVRRSPPELAMPKAFYGAPALTLFQAPTRLDAAAVRRAPLPAGRRR